MKKQIQTILIILALVAFWSCKENTTEEGLQLGGTVTDIDGNVYQTIIIGDQEWMAENLKVTHYRNGDPIPKGYSDSEWTILSTGAYSVYNDNSSNSETYGNLYNWYAVHDNRNIAPVGWHVPTDEEWTALIDYLGGSSIAGGKLKKAGMEHWSDPNEGATNESNFSALPGGYRHYSNGEYYAISDVNYFWSSTEYSNNNAWERILYFLSSDIGRLAGSKNLGYSVRCVRD